MKYNFDYFYGSQADQFTFIRIPKMMLTDEAFAALSLKAKVLYGVLLDRMSLSRKNGWLDGESRVFIIYQIGEIQQDLCLSKKKAMDLLSELEKYGLLEKKRRGHGLPNLLYVKSFLSFMQETQMPAGSADNAACMADTPHGSRSALFDTSASQYSDERSAGFDTSMPQGTCPNTAVCETSEPETKACEPDISGERSSFPNKNAVLCSTEDESASSPEWLHFDSRSAETVTSGIKKTDSRGAGNGTSRGAGFGTLEVPKTVLQEVSKMGPQEVPVLRHLKNNTDLNNTELNHIKSNHIIAPEWPARFDDDEMRYDESTTSGGGSSLAEEYRELICENIGYDELLASHPYDGELIAGIADLILETVLHRTEYILIASNQYPTELIRGKFLKLNYDHIEYVMDCLHRNTTKVRNIKKYLLTALFNAPSTIDGFYKAEVNHDIPELARAK